MKLYGSQCPVPYSTFCGGFPIRGCRAWWCEWGDVTTSVDTDANIICGTVSSLSPFIIAKKAGISLTIKIISILAIMILIITGIIIVIRNKKHKHISH